MYYFVAYEQRIVTNDPRGSYVYFHMHISSYLIVLFVRSFFNSPTLQLLSLGSWDACCLFGLLLVRSIIIIIMMIISSSFVSFGDSHDSHDSQSRALLRSPLQAASHSCLYTALADLIDIIISSCNISSIHHIVWRWWYCIQSYSIPFRPVSSVPPPHVRPHHVLSHGISSHHVASYRIASDSNTSDSSTSNSITSNSNTSNSNTSNNNTFDSITSHHMKSGETAVVYILHNITRHYIIRVHSESDRQ